MWQCHCHPKHLEKYGPNEPGETLPRSKYRMTVTALDESKPLWISCWIFVGSIIASQKSPSLGQFPYWSGKWISWGSDKSALDIFGLDNRQIWRQDTGSFVRKGLAETKPCRNLVKHEKHVLSWRSKYLATDETLHFLRFISFYRQICRGERSKCGVFVWSHDSTSRLCIYSMLSQPNRFAKDLCPASTQCIICKPGGKLAE